MIDMNLYLRITKRRIALKTEETSALKALLTKSLEKWRDGDHSEGVQDTITAILTIFKNRNVPY